MEIVYASLAFISGAGGVLALTLNHIFQSYSLSSQFISEELEKTKLLLEKKCEEFDAITKKASDANMSLASRIPEIDSKISDLSNRIQMMGLRLQSK